VATFSDIRTVATERAPFVASRARHRRAFRLAEQQASFKADDASPLEAAERIRVPVLLIHGQLDHETLPAHSERVLAALHGEKRLLLVPGAGTTTRCDRESGRRSTPGSTRFLRRSNRNVDLVRPDSPAVTT
jgi:pimeloyl-ACP methyl ester carboxylesterase